MKGPGIAPPPDAWPTLLRYAFDWGFSSKPFGRKKREGHQCVT